MIQTTPLYSIPVVPCFVDDYIHVINTEEMTCISFHNVPIFAQNELEFFLVLP